MNLEAKGIYSITTADTHAYVGMTSVSFKQRFSRHLYLLKSEVSSHHCFYLQNLYNLHGKDYFSFQILEELDDADPFLEREVYWWDAMKSQGYIMLNSRPSGTGSVIHDEATKQKISASLYKRNKNLALIEDNLSEIKLLTQDETISTQEIADKYGIAYRALKSYLSQHKIRNSFRRQLVAWEDYPIVQWVKEEKLSTRQIAKRVGCSQPAVVNYLKELRKNVTF